MLDKQNRMKIIISAQASDGGVYEYAKKEQAKQKTTKEQ
jgi:hypothetical protein